MTERRARRETALQDMSSCKILLFLILFACYTVKKSVNLMLLSV